MSERPANDDDRSVDVAIVGGGPAGLAAALFTARHGLRTLVFDRGRSLLRQCAYLENYLGFPGGIDVEEFLSLSRQQVKRAGARVEELHVVAVRRVVDGDTPSFQLHTSKDGEFAAARVIAASGTYAEYLGSLQDGLDIGLVDDLGELREEFLGPGGRTPVAGLYAAGPLASADNQAQISAGHGAQVALTLIGDVRVGKGLWDALSRHVDWSVKRGAYDSPEWERRVRAYFEPTAPATMDVATRDELIQGWMRLRRGQQLSPREIAARRVWARTLRFESAQQTSDGRSAT